MSNEAVTSSRIDHSTPARKLIWQEPRTFSGVPPSRAIYVSIDLDVLDISLTPGHGLPEPGGLSYRQLRTALAEVAARGKIVGFDVAELNPELDPGGSTARVATWLITHFLSEIFDRAH